MQRRLLLVADSSPLRDVTERVLQALPGVEVICAEDLSVAQQACRHVEAASDMALVLVELQRLKGNGFSLAAALSRGIKCPVLLLSDRNDEADRQWCRSRGISGCLSRLDGQQVFLRAVSRVLEISLDEPADSHVHVAGTNTADNIEIVPESRQQGRHTPQSERYSSSAKRRRSLVVYEAKQRLASILSDLLRSGETAGSCSVAVVDDGAREVQQRISFVIGLIDNEWRTLLFSDRAQPTLTAEDRWKCGLVLENLSAALRHPARQLARGVRFALAWQSAEVIRDELQQGLGRVIDGLESPDSQRAALHVLSISLSIHQLNPQSLPLRWLSELPALITYLAASRHGLQDWTHSELSWFFRRIGLGQYHGYLATDRQAMIRRYSETWFPASGVSADEEFWHRLEARPSTKACSEELSHILANTCDVPLRHKNMTGRALIQLCQRLCQALYQLMICAQLEPDERQSAAEKMNESLLLRSLYQSSRSLIWHYRRDKGVGCQHLLRLLNMLRAGHPGQVMTSLCLEIRLQEAVRHKSVQRRLAGGLDLLPRPDLVATSFMHNKSDISVLASDLQGELDRLVIDAEQLGVTWVGALAYALQQALQMDVTCFEPNMRRQVIRGLYRLCRMLDQAAAWQTVSAAPGTVNRLLQIKFGKNVSGVAEKMPHNYNQATDLKEKCQKCLRLNQLILRVVEEQKIQSGAASTLGRLITEQQRLLRDAFSP